MHFIKQFQMSTLPVQEQEVEITAEETDGRLNVILYFHYSVMYI